MLLKLIKIADDVNYTFTEKKEILDELFAKFPKWFKSVIKYFNTYLYSKSLLLHVLKLF